ncbi:MAG: LytTR family DNA-binding domain-containing protein [Bryobacterales bacterium]|nr:LytTR family DNA-binding domain-containing protein [Bryobacterales bacterium]
MRPDALFLDIHMPEIDGFALLSRLKTPPHVVFTTAYDEHAVRAFEVNSVDYLLKPVTRDKVSRALNRLADRLAKANENPAGLDALLRMVADSLRRKEWLRRVSTQVGQHLTLIDVDEVTHFVSEDRYTYACTGQGKHLIAPSLVELEERLDPAHFLRIHRGAIVNLREVARISRWFQGRLHVQMKNGGQLSVSREKVAKLRDALGL